jgi:hypothetical protein
MESSGVQEFRSSGVQEFRSSGVQEFRSSGVQEFRSIGAEKTDCKSQVCLFEILAAIRGGLPISATLQKDVLQRDSFRRSISNESCSDSDVLQPTIHAQYSIPPVLLDSWRIRRIRILQLLNSCNS